MIDCHCHILPGLDDGPQSLAESLAMCRAAVRDGVKAIVATPHDRNGVFKNGPERIRQAAASLRQRLEQEQIDLAVYPGAEIFADPELPRLIQQGEVLTFNGHGRAVLVEFPPRFLPEHALRLVKSLRQIGVAPILAHPERCPAFRRANVASSLVKEGALLQLTAMSLTGDFGRDVRRFSEKLLESEMVWLVGSDAHSAEYRPAILSKALTRASQLIGGERALPLFVQNPERLLKGHEAPHGKT